MTALEFASGPLVLSSDPREREADDYFRRAKAGNTVRPVPA